MTDREKLIEILRKPIFPHELADPTEAVADYLLNNGIVIREKGEWTRQKYLPPTCPLCSLFVRTPGFIGSDKFYDDEFKFCPHCGADMRGVKK